MRRCDRLWLSEEGHDVRHARAGGARGDPGALYQVRADTWAYSDTHQRGASGFQSSNIEMKVQRVDADDILIGVKARRLAHRLSGPPHGVRLRAR